MNENKRSSPLINENHTLYIFYNVALYTLLLPSWVKLTTMGVAIRY
jgi:hypothetical protein